MNWSTESRIGVVIQRFSPEHRLCLELKLGDIVITKGSSSGWFKGVVYNPSMPGERKGFFPMANVFFSDNKNNRLSRREGSVAKEEKKLDFENEKVLKKQLELPAGSWWENEMRHPLFKEAMDVFVDWSKHFDTYLSEEENADFLERILNIEAKIISLISHERKKSSQDDMQLQLAKLIEEGCSILNEDVVIRVKGKPLDETNSTAVALYRQYYEQQKKEERERELLREKRKKMMNFVKKESGNVLNRLLRVGGGEQGMSRAANTKEFYNLPEGNAQMLMEVENCIFTLEDKAELYFSLYSATEKKFISEEFLVPLPQNNDNENDTEVLLRRKTIFQNICAKDFVKELFIVVRVYRRGSIIPPSTKESDKNKRRVANGVGGGISNDFYTQYRRPFGIGVLELTPAIVSTLVSGEKYTTPENIKIYQPGEKGSREDIFSTMVDQVIEIVQSLQPNTARSISANGPSPSHYLSTKGICLSLSMFVVEYAELIEKQPELAWAPLSASALSPQVISPLKRSSATSSSSSNLLASAPSGHVSRTQIMGFPEVVSPGDRRNDIYVTVVSSQLTFSVKNVLLEAKLYLQSEGETKSRSVPFICGPIDCTKDEKDQMTTTWTSSVFYHSKNPRWMETFRLNIEPKDLEKAVLVFTFSDCASRHGSRTIFGFSYWELTNQKGLLNLGRNDSSEKHTNDDKEQNESILTVYKWNKQTLFDENIHAFIKNLQERSNHQTKSLLHIQHTVVSTLVTQNENLRNLLNWEKAKKTKTMSDILKHFMYCKPEETKTFLREIFDALFAILSREEDRSEEEQQNIAGLVYQALCQMIGTVVGRKTNDEDKYRAIVDQYISDHFNCPQAQKWIMIELNKRFDDVEKNTKSLLDSTKALTYIMEFIVVSRKQYEDLKKQDGNYNLEEDRAQFRTAMVKLIKKFEEVLKSNKEIQVGSQDNLLKYMAFDPLVATFVGEEHLLGTTIKEFLDAIPPISEKRIGMIKAKLELLSRIVQGQPFAQNATRAVVLPKIIEELELHFSRLMPQDPTPIKGSSEQTLCVRVLGEMLDTLQQRLQDGCGESDKQAVLESLHQIFPLMKEVRTYYESLVAENDKINLILNPPLDENAVQQQEGTDRAAPAAPLPNMDISERKNNIARQAENERARADIICDLLALLYMYAHYELLPLHLKVDSSIGAGLTTIDEFFRLQQLVLSDSNPIARKSSPFSTWIQYQIFLFQVIITSMHMFSSTLIELSSQCDMDDIVQRFSTFTDNLFRAVLNLSAVQVETMPSFKRKKVLHALGGVDLRVQLLQLFLTRWNQLSHEVKRKFVPGLVNKVMRVFDINIVEPKLTEKAVDIYYNLLAVEFEDKKSFDACEGETQKSLVEFKIDDRFKDAFIEGMRQKFIREQEQQEKISIAGLQLLDRISTMLVQVEEIQKYADTDEDEKTQVCIEVMHSFLSKENLDLYFKYVHILSKMHVNLGSFVEAALTLQTHCDRLSFSSDRILPYFSEEYKEEKESRRRELMILRMIDLLDKGKDWERAITWCKELRKFYEETWQYQQLEELLKREGTFYTNIMTKKRFPAFFHVAFYGKGFRDIHLEGIYVYKSKELENHVEFANKMKKKYPQAELLTKPPQDVQALNERDGQFFEVFAISAITQREINNEYVARDPRRSPKIVKYEQLNNVTHLATARRYRESDEKAPNGYDFMDMHREIRIFRVPQPFPCERRRQKVVEVITIDLDPLENAIKDVEDKTLDLQDSVISHRLDARPDTNELSMHLTGVIDAPVNGGMGKYIEYFFGEEYIKTHPNCKPLLVRFAKALQAQLEILKDGLYYRRYFSSGKALALSDHLERLYAKMVEDCKAILEKYL